MSVIDDIVALQKLCGIEPTGIFDAELARLLLKKLEDYQQKEPVEPSETLKDWINRQ